MGIAVLGGASIERETRRDRRRQRRRSASARNHGRTSRARRPSRRRDDSKPATSRSNHERSTLGSVPFRMRPSTTTCAVGASSAPDPIRPERANGGDATRRQSEAGTRRRQTPPTRGLTDRVDERSFKRAGACAAMPALKSTAPCARASPIRWVHVGSRFAEVGRTCLSRRSPSTKVARAGAIARAGALESPDAGRASSDRAKGRDANACERSNGIARVRPR